MTVRKNGKPVNNEILTLLREIRTNAEVSRLALAQFMADSNCHDVDKACDYPRSISFSMYNSMYEREGIATRVVNVFPTETWTVVPWVYETELVEEDEQTEFEKAYKELSTRLNLQKTWAELDEISGLGHYGVMLIGVNDGKKLDQPLDGIDENGEYVEGDFPEREVIYLSVFNESQAPISDWNRDKNSKRFGHPLFYNLLIADPSQQQATQGGTYRLAPPTADNTGESMKVHWSRVIHVADNCRTSKIFGTPRMKNVFNYLLNLRRILGGSAEMFWNGGFPGTAFEVPPEIVHEVDLDTEALTEEIESYYKRFKRYLALKGVTAKQLLPNIEDPTSTFEIQITAICIAIGVPKRLFMGTEEARLASIQDKDTWNRKVHRRNDTHVTPVIVRPTVDRFIAIRALPKPAVPYSTQWPDVYAISETDKADVTGKLVKALAEYIESGAFKLIPPLQFLTMIMDLTPAEAEIIIEASLEAEESQEFEFLTPEDPMAEVDSELDEPSGPQKRILRNELISNPVMRCMSNGAKGFKYGQSGRCYTYAEGDDTGKRRARKKARLQGIAIEASRRLQAMEETDEKSKSELQKSISSE
jgi:uncharacterized protein